jgi:hypothetical protein
MIVTPQTAARARLHQHDLLVEAETRRRHAEAAAVTPIAAPVTVLVTLAALLVVLAIAAALVLPAGPSVVLGWRNG